MSCQPGKHAKQPLEKQNSPLSRACGMSMIYLGRNLPSVLISLKETATKIATGCSKINQLSCAVAFPLFPLMLNPNSHASIHVFSPSPQQSDGYPCRVIADSTEELGHHCHWQLEQKSCSQPAWAEGFPTVGELFGRQGRSQWTQMAHPDKQSGLQVSGSRIRITVCWHRRYWLNIVCET